VIHLVFIGVAYKFVLMTEKPYAQADTTVQKKEVVVKKTEDDKVNVEAEIPAPADP
jgi:hypothetical protein